MHLGIIFGNLDLKKRCQNFDLKEKKKQKSFISNLNCNEEWIGCNGELNVFF